MKKILSTFLQRYHESGSPLLLALSGGPDSLLLYHLLLEEKRPFHVAHVNHGWRPQSEVEESILSTMCLRDHVPFHLKKLSKDEGRSEEEARECRLEFFKTLSEKHHFQAVILGHHGDDQAETVLKRVFEGASLHHLKGLSPFSVTHGVTLWRPLLNVRKKEIVKALSERGLTPFIDPTNCDPKYLRSRLRHTLLPYLSEVFGKEVTSSLCRLGESAFELHEFVDEILKQYEGKMEHREDCSTLDLRDPPKTQFEWKMIVRAFFEKEKITLSHFVLEAVIEHLKKKSVGKAIQIAQFKVRFEAGKLVLIKI